jgi:phospholipid transport system substrate-binding protein
MNLTAIMVRQECLAQEFFRDLPMSLPRDLRQLLSPGRRIVRHHFAPRADRHTMIQIEATTRLLSAHPVRRRVVLRTAVLGVLAAPGFVAADDIPDAAIPIQALCNALLVIMKAGRATPFPQRFATLAPIVDRALNIQLILQVAVGPRWASSTPEQQSALQSAFRSYTIATYVENFDEYSGDRFEVPPELRPVGDGDQIVHTRFISSSGDPRVIDYVMRQTDGVWKAADVLLDGTISRVAVLRSEFRHILAEGGLPALLKELQQKVSDLSGGAITG